MDCCCNHGHRWNSSHDELDENAFAGKKSLRKCIILNNMEPQELFGKINEELLELKDKDPEKYLELLKQLNSIIEDLNKDIEAV